MNEHFLQFFWKHYSKTRNHLRLTDGTRIEVYDPGEWNFESGPDFSAATIRIGDTRWVGNVEIHLKASDWYKHHHQHDPAYQNIILHVVGQYDKPVYSDTGRQIPTLELKVPRKLWQTYESLLQERHTIKCSEHLGRIDSFKFNFWMGRMAIERLEAKSNLLEHFLIETRNDWEASLYRLFARSFGQKSNSMPFEMLARNLPLSIIAKHRNRRFQLEALIFGQAGLLQAEWFGDDYFQKLRAEYLYHKHKYQLKSLPGYLWKFSGTRPSSFPNIRLAQWIRFLESQPHLLPFTLEFEPTQMNQLRKELQLDEYWENHYRFNKISLQKGKAPGTDWAHHFIINAIAPALYHYGKTFQQTEMQEKAIAMLEKLKPENNQIIRAWNKKGQHPKNALNTQAYIHLYQQYCSKSHCLQCQIGNEIIRLPSR